MKRLLAALALAAALSAPAFAADEAPGSPFGDANLKYQKGDFKAAEAAYEKMTADGPVTAARFYNLGNAAFRNGKKGKALLNYERALDLAPRDSDARWNASVVRTALTDRIGAPSDPLEAASEKVSSEVSGDEAAAAFAAALALWALASFAVFAGARGGFFLSLRSLTLVLSVFSGLVLGAVMYAHRDPRAVVLVKEVVARYGPSVRETKAFVLHEGAEARITDSAGDWVYVTLSNGSSGWIPRASCETV